MNEIIEKIRYLLAPKSFRTSGVTSCCVVDKNGFMVDGYNEEASKANKVQLVTDLATTLGDLLTAKGLKSISFETDRSEYHISTLKNDNTLMMTKTK